MYTRQVVEELLFLVFYPDGRGDLRAPAPGMPTAKADPALSGTVMAVVADLRNAWGRAGLSLDEKRAMFVTLVLGAGWTGGGRLLGCVRQTVTARVEAGVGKMVEFLNGEI